MRPVPTWAIAARPSVDARTRSTLAQTPSRGETSPRPALRQRLAGRGGEGGHQRVRARELARPALGGDLPREGAGHEEAMVDGQLVHGGLGLLHWVEPAHAKRRRGRPWYAPGGDGGGERALPRRPSWRPTFTAAAAGRGSPGGRGRTATRRSGSMLRPSGSRRRGSGSAYTVTPSPPRRSLRASAQRSMSAPQPMARSAATARPSTLCSTAAPLAPVSTMSRIAANV